MNYRHVYHAGNFADAVKHIALLMCLEYLQRKDNAICVFDSHGGSGLYDLASAEAAKTGEWERGAGRLASAFPAARNNAEPGGAATRQDAPADLRLYLDAVAPDMAAQRYPGSPLLIARRLRRQDRLIAAELHEPSHNALSETLSPFPAARALHMDGYEMLRAHLPPPERRGLALIDPPYERRDEFEMLIGQMREWRKRWATGLYLIWYPIKAHLPADALKVAARGAAMPRIWWMETLVAPRDQAQTLNGCGMLILNAPFGVPERMEAMAPLVQEGLGLYAVETGWEVAG